MTANKTKVTLFRAGHYVNINITLMLDADLEPVGYGHYSYGVDRVAWDNEWDNEIRIYSQNVFPFSDQEQTAFYQYLIYLSRLQEWIVFRTSADFIQYWSQSAGNLLAPFLHDHLEIIADTAASPRRRLPK